MYANVRLDRAWITSSIALHLAEATGLHHELDSITLTDTSASHPVKAENGCEQARKIFWCAWIANTMICTFKVPYNLLDSLIRSL